MAKSYCTPAEVKALMPDAGLSTTYDTLLNSLAERASRMFDNEVGKWPGYFFGEETETRYYDGNGERRLWIDEAAAITSVEVDVDDSGVYTTWTLGTDYLNYPRNPSAVRGLIHALDIKELSDEPYWPAYQNAVKVTAQFGYASPPPDIKQAAITQTVRFFKRGQQAFADVGAVPELGQLRYVSALDPDVKEILRAYISVF